MIVRWRRPGRLNRRRLAGPPIVIGGNDCAAAIVQFKHRILQPIGNRARQ